MKKILIVDDQVEVRELVDVTLSSPDRKILKAASGEEALKIARREKPELIIMDIMMLGRIDGLQAVGNLKGDTRTRDIIVLVLTAKGQKEDIKKGYEAGADDYFTKPFSPLELIRKVDGILESGAG